MLDLGFCTAATLPTVAEICLSVIRVVSELNFPSLRVHDEANAQHDDTMDDHCEQMIMDCGSVPS